jgi:penicillin amidase
LLLLVCLAAAAAWFLFSARAALPKLDGTLRVTGLNSQVTVLRDARGVPTITAASLDDLFFAQGYVTAQDRLWQMDMSRRYAAGELSEVLGADYLETDTSQRVLGLRQVAEANATRATGATRQYLEAYARGVNAYIADHSHSLPLEFDALRYSPRPWTPADSFLVGAMMSEMLNQNSHKDELEREWITARIGPELTADLLPAASGRDILPDGERPFSLADPTSSKKEAVATPTQAAPIVPAQAVLAATTAQAAPPTPRAVSRRHRVGKRSPGPRHPARRHHRAFAADPWGEPALVPGSNNWVISGAHTASGRPLLANDMHLPHRIPNTWYELHLASGDYDVAGVTLPGLPCVVVGHNRRIAWGFTNLGPDVQDLYVETFNQSGEYLTPEGWRKPEDRKSVV